MATLARGSPCSRESNTMSIAMLVEARCFALPPEKRWLACLAFLLVVAAECSSALDNRQRPAPDAGPGQVDRRPTDEPTFPNPELAAKHEAAKASPQSFDVLLDYAKAVADFCLASLVDESCAPNCPKGAVKYKPMSDLDPKNWVLAQNALAALDPLKDGQGLPPAQFEQFVSVKGRLLGLAGHAEEEQTLIDGYVLAHPDAVSIVRRRLELLRQAGNVKESEGQCARSRVSMKSAPERARTELLTSCVALHPDNKEGRTDPPDYTRYLPSPAKAEQRLYRKHLIQRCVEGVGSKETRCAEACACKDKSADKQEKAKCKEGCRNCRVETAQKIRECKKTGSPASAPRTGAGDATPATGPEPEKTVL
jgi:hypothetical protein